MLYYVIQQGGDIKIMTFSTLINLFFFIYIISFFITIYYLYTFFEYRLFHNLQGSKLKIKQKIEKQE